MDIDEPTVIVVDDDAAVGTSLQRLLRSEGWHCETFASAEAFLARAPLAGIGCLLLDVQMPGLCGPALQERLIEGGCTWPIIFLTGHGDVPTGVDAMKRGAVDFLLKPVDDTVLLGAVRRALARHAAGAAHRLERADILHRVQRLSPREREVMDGVLRGRLNKQIAGDLAISEKTVKVHRARVMEKMEVRSVAALVHLCDAAGITVAEAEAETFTVEHIKP